MNPMEEFDVPDYEYVEREWGDDEDGYWKCIEEAMYCNFYSQLLYIESFRYQEYCWLKELRHLRLILNKPDKKDNSVDSFENLEDAIESLSDSQSDAELQIRDWLILLKKARDTATNFQYNGDQYKVKQ